MGELRCTRLCACRGNRATRDIAATELYRAAERLLVIAGRLRGVDFYARAIDGST